MEKKNYLFQCIGGHVGNVPEGSDLEERAKAREVIGLMDAIILCPEDCPDCQSEANERMLRSLF